MAYNEGRYAAVDELRDLFGYAIALWKAVYAARNAGELLQLWALEGVPGNRTVVRDANGLIVTNLTEADLQGEVPAEELYTFLEAANAIYEVMSTMNPQKAGLIARYMKPKKV